MRHSKVAVCDCPYIVGEGTSMLWCVQALHTASLLAGGRDSVKAGPKGEKSPVREDDEGGEKMQAKPVYLPIEISHKSQESMF